MKLEPIDSKGSDHFHSVYSLRAGHLEIDARGSTRGLIYVVEEKSWSREWEPADDQTWLKRGTGNDRKSPFLQAWNAMIAVKEKIEPEPALLNSDGPHQGKSSFRSTSWWHSQMPHAQNSRGSTIRSFSPRACLQKTLTKTSWRSVTWERGWLKSRTQRSGGIRKCRKMTSKSLFELSPSSWNWIHH